MTEANAGHRHVGGRTVRAVLAAVLLGLSIGVLAGCGEDGDEGGEAQSGETAAAEELTIGGSFPSFGPFYIAMNSLIEREIADTPGTSYLEPANANYDSARQVTDVRNLITAGANGILIPVGDPRVIAPALADAQRREVDVVALDVAPGGGEVYMVVRADNRAMAVQACEEMGERLDGRGKVLQLLGDLVSINAQDRTEGFNECMEENFPEIEVISRPTLWKAEEAASETQTVLNANPDLAGIYMQSDAVHLSSVLSVLERAGKDAKVGEEGHIVLVSIDGIPQALGAIRADRLDALVSQPIDLYAQYGVKYLQDAAAGKTYEPGPSDHDTTIVETEGGSLEDQLPSPLVTKENVDDPSLWGNVEAEE